MNSTHIAFDWLKLVYAVIYDELFYHHLVFKYIYGICWKTYHYRKYIYYIFYPIYNRYKNVSKTDVRQSWIKNPKSAPPRQTKTMEELFPAPDRFVNYRLANNNFITVSVLHAYDIQTVNDFIFAGFNIAWVFALLILLYILSKHIRATNRPVYDRDREFLYHKLTSVGRFQVKSGALCW